MKAIIKAREGIGNVELAQRPVPQINENEVLIKVRKAGICGTDFHIYKWDKWSQNRIKPPLVMGHEFAGEIVQMDKAVKGLYIGQRVSAEDIKPARNQAMQNREVNLHEYRNNRCKTGWASRNHKDQL